MAPPRIVAETATDCRPISEVSGQRPTVHAGGVREPSDRARRFVVRGRGNRRLGLRVDERVIELSSGPITLGRAPDCELSSEDQLLSRRHAELEARSRGVLVTDLDSTNGVYVNGVRIQGETIARPGDWISLGMSILEVLEIDGTVAVESPPSSAAKPPSVRRRSTQPGSALLAIAGVAERALASEKSERGERMLDAPLDKVLQRALAGRHVDPHEAQMAAVLAARLAEAAGGGRWARYCFRLYAALARPLPSQAIDRLYQVFHRAGEEDLRELARYLDVLEDLAPESLGDSGRELVRRVAGLAQLSRER